MSNIAVISSAGSLPTYVYPGGYDEDELGLGPLMLQNNGVTNEDKWVGPIPVSVARPIETSAAIPAVYPAAARWSDQYDWVFFADAATAAATRRFQLFRFDKTASSNPWSWSGFITASIPFAGTQGTYSIRGLEVSYEKYTTGTVSINNGSASLTGSGTTWSADRIFIGSRIGFGSTDPAQITTWYEISAIGSDTAITLTQNFASSNISDASYVIEDLRLLFVATNGTTASNAGLFMIGGLRYENFSVGGTAISAAATTSKVRATYWLSDGNAASNSTIQAFGGIAIDAKTSWTSQLAYCGDYAAGQSRFMVSNFRAAMTVGGTTSGRDGTSNTFQFNTGQQAVTGTVSQVNNLVLCTPSHGPRNGVKSLFWVTTTRFYSAVVSGITTGSTAFQSGAATEVPPGSTTTFAALGTLQSINYSGIMDRFFIFTTGIRSYITQYREDAGQWDRYLLVNTGQLNQSTADTTSAVWPTALAAGMSAVNLNGMTYLATTGTTAVTNLIYNIPYAADWEYVSSSNSCVVFPVMDTSKFSQFVLGFFNNVEIIGGRTGYNLGLEPGATRMYYRTSGISDNSGSWTLLDYSGDMSSVPGADQIQVKLEFRTITPFALQPRVNKVGFIGLGTASDEHFQFSQKHSSLADKEFAFRYSRAFGGTVPTLYVRIYDAVTGDLLVDDDSVSQVGTWEKSTNDGSSWTAFNTSDRANETTYFRFTPASIADDVDAMPTVRLS